MNNEVILLNEADDFIETLPIKFQAKTYWTLTLLQRFGNKLKEPYCKDIKGYAKLKELLVKFSNNINRLFFFHYKSKIYVVTSGYVKKTQKLDTKEIDKAFRLMKEFIEEHKT